jgi:2,4-dienoyl-CoA reductase-like NADH-dependent reductase (Old Yellow Enzyme family)
VEVSTAGPGAIRTRINRIEKEAYLIEEARAVKARVSIPVALVGGIRSRVVMAEALAEGFSMVSMSRPLIREPDLPAKLARGEVTAASCRSCNRCWPKERGDGISCKAGR